MNQSLAQGGPISLPDVDSANNQGTGIKYSGSYGTQVSRKNQNSRCCSPVPLSLVFPLLLRLSCLGTSLSNRHSHTLHMLFYDSHGSNNSCSNGSWDGGTSFGGV